MDRSITSKGVMRWNKVVRWSFFLWIWAMVVAAKPLISPQILLIKQTSPDKTQISTAEPISAPEVNQIIIQSPGQSSQVLAPIHVEAEVKLFKIKTIRIDLQYSEAEVLARKVYAMRNCSPAEEISSNPLVLDVPMMVCFQSYAKIQTNLNFNLGSEEQRGYLQISTFDEQQRMRSLNSVEVQLLSKGKQNIQPPTAEQQLLKIITPHDGEEIQGGTLIVKGIAPIAANLPLRLTLTTEEGQVVGSRMANILNQSIDSRSGKLEGTFSIEMKYKIKKPQKVLLSVSTNSETFKGALFLTSQEVFLLP